MVLTALRITNARNHRSSALSCPPGVIVLCGENGAGKTTMLEAVSLLCATRSFVTSNDRNMITAGEDNLRVEGDFLSDTGSRHTVSYEFPAFQSRRLLTMDNAVLSSPSDLFGRFPIVTLSPLQREITAGGPAERRSFVDFVISQVHRSHLLDLIEYRKILAQRAALLSDSMLSMHRIRDLLEPWNHTCAEHAVRISRRRLDFLETFEPCFHRIYPAIVEQDEMPSFRYAAAGGIDYRAADAADAVLGRLVSDFENDYRRRSTGAGPHRDDIEILLNGLDARSRASQGQHKSILVAMKIAEYDWLREQLEETPILLFDDVFSELDNGRLAGTLRLLTTAGQVFVTTANESIVEHLPGSEMTRTVFRVRNGSILHGAG
jgi:DNA replication and repair protein RecF